MGLSRTGFPGDGYMYVICDVCGKKVRQRDTVVRKDKYNQQNNLVMCKDDVDKPQPSLRPIRIREKYRPNPSDVRSEPTDTYIVNANATRIPSAPTLLRAAGGSGVVEVVALSWIGPSDPGDSGIIGYVIWRETIGAPGDIIISNTNSTATYYEDTTLNINSIATYKVSAINSSGMGPYSNIAYFPIETNELDEQFLQTSDTGAYILTGDNLYIRVGT